MSDKGTQSSSSLPTVSSESIALDVGEDWGSPVSWTYERPFAFTGKLERGTIEVE